MEITKDLLLSGTTLAGSTVYSADDEPLGQIKDLMIEVDRGLVAYAVLASDNDRYRAVPLEALRFLTAGNERKLVLDVKDNWQEEAPGFDQDHWPRQADPEFTSRMHQYYNTRAGFDTTAGYDSQHESVAHG